MPLSTPTKNTHLWYAGRMASLLCRFLTWLARIGQAFALLAASRSGGSLPLIDKAMFCAEGHLWISDISRATERLMLIVGKYAETAPSEAVS